MKLLACTHVPHWIDDGKVMSSAYFVRDLRIFGDLFDEVHICAPLSKEPPNGDVVAYEGDYSITNCPVIPGSDFWSRLSRLIGMPLNIVRISRAMHDCDAVHIRCPGNMGLFGAIALCFSTKPRCAKYAGQWGCYVGEPVANKIQRWLLSRRGFGGPVTVNATWDGHRGHVYSVFNSSITREEVVHAAETAVAKNLGKPVEFLFVGRVDKNKNLDIILRALASARRKSKEDLRLIVVGEGRALGITRDLALGLGLKDEVEFTGWLHPTDLAKVYARGHILLLASGTEGWPKTPMEAMCYGIPSICTNVGTVPKILGENERGLLVEPGDVQGLAEAMTRLATDEELYTRLSRAGRKWIESRTREDLMIELKSILEESWGLKLRTPEWMENENVRGSYER